MGQTKVFLFMVSIMILQSCTQNNNIFWVSGTKTECQGAMGKMKCLSVHKGEDLKKPNWENFYAPIDGFEFEEGYLQKIEVEEIHLDKSEVPADASSIRYKLVKVLEKKKDVNAKKIEEKSNKPNQRLHDIWGVKRINGKPINRKMDIPGMEIDLIKMRVLGSDGCNNYNGFIKEVSDTKIVFDKIASTRKMCRDMEISGKFNAAIKKVKGYRLKELNLILVDETGKEVLAFVKGD